MSRGLLEGDREINASLEDHKIRYIDVMQDLAKFNNIISSLHKSMEDFKRREEREIREIEQDKSRLTELTDKNPVAYIRSGKRRRRISAADRSERNGCRRIAASQIGFCRWFEERIVQIKEETGGKTIPVTVTAGISGTHSNGRMTV